jgi:hypothetical protein
MVMENSALGVLGKRIVAWIVIVAVVLLALKLAVGLVVGLMQAVFVMILAVAAIAGLVWAFRHA